MKNKALCAIAGAALCAASCSGPSGWSLKGEIEGSHPEKVALEGYNNGIWYLIDSLKVDAGGNFSYKAEAPAAYPEIFRLTASGHDGGIYFPADSCDKVTVLASGEHFGTGYTLGGTPEAATFGRVDSLVAATVAANGAQAAATNPDLRRRLVDIITADTTGTVAFYVVGKAVGGKQIFDPSDAFGNRIYGAAAQVFSQYAPFDPRGAALRRSYFEGRQALGKMPESTSQQIIEVPEAGFINIENYDDRGVRHSLAELAEKGKFIVLSFTAYGADTSVPYNAILNDIYTRYHDRGLEIFQIAFDSDEQTWKTVARNLPWITVWNSPADGASALVSYNVGAFPATFLIDRSGVIAARVTNPDDLAKEVAKYF